MKISWFFKYIKSHYSKNDKEDFSIFAELEWEEMALICSLMDSVHPKEGLHVENY